MQLDQLKASEIRRATVEIVAVEDLPPTAEPLKLSPAQAVRLLSFLSLDPSPDCRAGGWKPTVTLNLELIDRSPLTLFISKRSWYITDGSSKGDQPVRDGFQRELTGIITALRAAQ